MDEEYRINKDLNVGNKGIDELERMSDDISHAISHLESSKENVEDEIQKRKTSGSVTPQTYHMVADAIYQGKSYSGGHKSEGYEDGVRSNGFVHKLVMGRGALVGLDLGGAFIVAQIQRGSETVGRSDPKLQTRINEYVEAEFRECEFEGDYDDIDGIKDAYEDGESLERGYIGGYRVSRLSEVLDDVFGYYSVEE